jgi:zinc protease
MKTISRTILVICSALFLIQFSNGQSHYSGAVPFDPEVKTGVLENGLTYYIRYNKEPEKRASFYFIQNVGALLENDDQNGLAHFLEHMAFNGTLHFPSKAIISSLEKHGVAFGSNINASTNQDETVYNLSDVPVDPPGLMDTCLLVLYDWSDFISLTDKEIDAERPVIIEEWRTGRDAETRMREQYMPVLLKDSKYAVRDVIGNIDVINNFNYNTLKQFYFEWYRPDLQAIAIVGDIDVNEMEKKIKSLFSQLKPAENPKPRPVFDVPPHKETYFVLATDREAPQTSVNLIILSKGTDPEKKDLGFLREGFLLNLMNSMIAERINDLLQKGNPPFINGSISSSKIVRGYNALFISATAKPNQEDMALSAIYTEAERVRRDGFTDAELSRAKADFLTGFESFYKQRDKIPNDYYIERIQNYFLSKSPFPSIDFEFEFIKEMLPSVTAEEISQLYRKRMVDDNRTVIIMGTEDKKTKHLSETEAKDIIRRVQSSEISQYHDVKLGTSLINETLPGSKVVKTSELKQFGAVEWTLANNAKVVFKRVDYEKDNVILSAYSPGGTSLYETDMLPSAAMLPAIIETYGIGNFDNSTLQKMLSGKKASAGITLSELNEGFSGSSTPKDFETMMQLLWLRFEKPRFDKEAHDAIMARYAAYITNLSKDPTKIMQDSVSLFLTNYNKRTSVMNKEFLEKVDLEKIRRIYAERFRNASDFVFFIVGNISEDTAKLMVEKYIGSIKSYPGSEKWIDRKVMPPKGKFVKEVQIPMAVPKATVFISHNSLMKYNQVNNVTLKVLQGILDLVFTEKVREEAGGTYGVSLNIGSSKFPVPQASDLIMFDCDPAKTNDLKAIIYSELNKIVTSGPSQAHLDKTVSNLLKNREESRVHNSYWSNVLYSYYYTGIDVNDSNNFEGILKKLTISDVKKVAALFLSKADLADIVFRPKVE